MTQTVHNPDQYMADLRQVLAQGRKRIGLLIGAGAPSGIQMPRTGGSTEPLIPATLELTKQVIRALDADYGLVLRGLAEDLGGSPNIEQVLTRARALGDTLGAHEVHGLNGKRYSELESALCTQIHKHVDVRLPEGPNPYSTLASWIGGTPRDHAVEVFTTNYDLLMEEALERARVPYFDGFSGSKEPFFDPATIVNGDLPPRWARLWKLHGSIGWSENENGAIVRLPGNACIYPTDRKYDLTRKLPYAALIDRLRAFLGLPDTILLSCGFSFSDAHLSAVLDESLAGNPAATVLAFQFRPLAEEPAAVRLATDRANLSVYAPDAAVINCIRAPWVPSDLPHVAWAPIRASFWLSKDNKFTLGDFSNLITYVALTRADQRRSDDDVEATGTSKP